MNELFVMSLKASRRSEGTIREYTKAIENCMAHVNKPEAEIKPIDLELWQSSMSIDIILFALLTAEIEFRLIFDCILFWR